VLTTYAGSGTYSFQGSDDSTGSGLSFTLGGYQVGTQGATPLSPASTCNVTVTGPASLTTGARVAGTFHCDDVFVDGDYVLLDGGTSSPFMSVDGQFEGEVL
jgi:hypothetical protein